MYSRRIVGWQVGETMEDELVIVPLRRALKLRQPTVGLIVHSDRGGQYVSTELKELIRLWHIRPSMSRAAPRWLTIPTTTLLRSRCGSDRRAAA
ncbi:MAG: hypothetical protein EOO77_42595 [Oxalobacteraceae bacterium]|nr:MAG: hypothetical protein EOO77_42595 [Oxalobacteraceae bacterium]